MYIKNFPASQKDGKGVAFSEADLKQMFAPFGMIANSQIVGNANGDGWGFVHFENSADADKALSEMRKLKKLGKTDLMVSDYKHKGGKTKDKRKESSSEDSSSDSSSDDSSSSDESHDSSERRYRGGRGGRGRGGHRHHHDEHHHHRGRGGWGHHEDGEFKG